MPFSMLPADSWPLMLAAATCAAMPLRADFAAAIMPR